MLFQVNLSRLVIMPFKIYIRIIIIPQSLCILHSHHIFRVGCQRINRTVPQRRTCQPAGHQFVHQFVGYRLRQIHMMVNLIPFLVIL